MEERIIRDAIKSIMGVGLSAIMGTSRLQEYVFARMIMAKELFTRTTMTIDEIGTLMNKTTKMVQYYIERYNIDVKSYRQFKEKAIEVSNYLDEYESEV